MADNQLVTLSRKFAVCVINVSSVLKEEKKGTVLVNQLLRSGTSIGANIHEANYASSRSDIINKFQIALKECYETEYWLDIFRESKIISQENYDDLSTQCNKIRILLIASINTAKGKEQSN